MTRNDVGIAIAPDGLFWLSVGHTIYQWVRGAPTATVYATAPEALCDLTFHRGVLWAVSQHHVYRAQDTTLVDVTPGPQNFLFSISGGNTGDLLVGRCKGSTCPIQRFDPVAGTLTNVVNWFQGTMPFGVTAHGLGGGGPGSCEPRWFRDDQAVERPAL